MQALQLSQFSRLGSSRPHQVAAPSLAPGDHDGNHGDHDGHDGHDNDHDGHDNDHDDDIEDSINFSTSSCLRIVIVIIFNWRGLPFILGQDYRYHGLARIITTTFSC